MRAAAIAAAIAAGLSLACAAKAADAVKPSEAAVPAPAPGKSVIQFDRPIAKGSQFDCNITATCNRSVSLSVTGVDSPLLSSESTLATLIGRLSVLEVNEAGNISKLRFEVKEIDGNINHSRPDLLSLQGKAVIAELNPPVCKFSMEGADQAPLSKDAVKLLSSVFRPAQKSGMKDLLGTEKPVGPGDSWTPPYELLISSLAKRGIKLTEHDLDGSVKLLGRENFKGIDCWRIEERIDTKNVPSFDLRLTISILLPIDPALGGAVKISRSGVELVKKDLPDSNPLSAGKIVEGAVRDSMEATIVPVKAEQGASR